MGKAKAKLASFWGVLVSKCASCRGARREAGACMQETLTKKKLAQLTKLQNSGGIVMTLANQYSSSGPLIMVKNGGAEVAGRKWWARRKTRKKKKDTKDGEGGSAGEADSFQSRCRRVAMRVRVHSTRRQLVAEQLQRVEMASWPAMRQVGCSFREMSRAAMRRASRF